MRAIYYFWPPVGVFCRALRFPILGRENAVAYRFLSQEEFLCIRVARLYTLIRDGVEINFRHGYDVAADTLQREFYKDS